MKMKDYEYAGVKLPMDVREKVKRIATEERRSFGKQSLIFIELGLKEYERTKGIAQQEHA